MRIEDMIDGVVARFIGTKHERDIKKLAPKLAAINALAGDYERLTDSEITEKSAQLKTEVMGRLEGADPTEPDYKQRLADALEPAIPQAFALAREAGRRTLSMRHFDVQMIGGMVLHEGKIAEMKTGEGKTLVATLPAYLNSLTGKG